MTRLQEPEADERGCQGHKGFMHPGFAIRAQAQFAKTVKPRRRALDNPTEDPQTAAMFSVLTCQSGTDTAAPQGTPMGLRIISPVTEENVGPPARVADLAAHLRNGVHDVKQLADVVPVGTRDRHRQRDAMTIGDQVVLGARLAAIRRVW